MNLHWATILLPPPIIDYVLVHELVHLHEVSSWAGILAEA